jgi:DNA-binding XRE family transcriptional regulator
MHPRTRRALDELPAEQRAAAEAAIARAAARRATPEGRAEQEEVIRKVREEFPPLRPDAETLALIAALRQQRERRGLSLDDVAERSGISRAALGGLEDGRIPSPTLTLLRRYAAAVGQGLRVTLVEERPADLVGSDA